MLLTAGLLIWEELHRLNYINAPELEHILLYTVIEGVILVPPLY